MTTYLALTVFTCGCRRLEVAAPWSPPVEVDAPPNAAAATDDGGTDRGPLDATVECVLRASPPIDLGANPQGGSRSAISGGRNGWGVVWQESIDQTDTVFFAFVGLDGRRRAAPIRLTERGMRGRSPTIYWNGSVWLVLSSGGNDRWDELWIQRVDPLGSRLGSPRRVSSRDRHDRWGTFAPAPERGAMLAWSSEIPGQNQTIQTIRLGEWGQQLSRASLIVERIAPLSQLAMVPWRQGYALCWTSTRRSSFVLECAQLDQQGVSVGSVIRIAEQTVGEGEQGPPIALAQDSSQLVMAWEQFNAGDAEVVFGSLSGRLERPQEMHSLVLSDVTAHAPALTALGGDRWAFGYQRSYGGSDQSVVLTIQNGWNGTDSPYVRLRGNDGTAERPQLSVIETKLAVLSSSPRGLSVHTLSIAACGGP